MSVWGVDMHAGVRAMRLSRARLTHCCILGRILFAVRGVRGRRECGDGEKEYTSEKVGDVRDA